MRRKRGLWDFVALLSERIERHRRFAIASDAEKKLPRPQHVTRLLSLVLGAGAELCQRRFRGMVDFEQSERELPLVKGLLFTSSASCILISAIFILTPGRRVVRVEGLEPPLLLGTPF